MISKLLLSALLPLALLTTACSKKEQPLTSPKEALQKYIGCIRQKNVDCMSAVIPEVTKKIATEAFADLIKVRTKVKSPKKLACIAKKAGFKAELLTIHSYKDLMAYAMASEKVTNDSLIKNMKYKIKTIRRSGNHYIASTYDGTLYRINKGSEGRFHVVPSARIRRKLNKMAAAAALMVLLVEKGHPCESK